MPTNREYLTVPELANELGVDQCKILGWIHKGELRALNVAENPTGRPRWRIPADAWEQFQQARTNQAAAPVARSPRRRRGDGYVMKFYV
jgi:excisionase family DNA binding protein